MAQFCQPQCKALYVCSLQLEHEPLWRYPPLLDYPSPQARCYFAYWDHAITRLVLFKFKQDVSMQLVFQHFLVECCEYFVLIHDGLSSQ